MAERREFLKKAGAAASAWMLTPVLLDQRLFGIQRAKLSADGLSFTSTSIQVGDDPPEREHGDRVYSFSFFRGWPSQDRISGTAASGIRDTRMDRRTQRSQDHVDFAVVGERGSRAVCLSLRSGKVP
jgi:hypothetical protein